MVGKYLLGLLYTRALTMSIIINGNFPFFFHLCLFTFLSCILFRLLCILYCGRHYRITCVASELSQCLDYCCYSVCIVYGYSKIPNATLQYIVDIYTHFFYCNISSTTDLFEQFGLLIVSTFFSNCLLCTLKYQI